MLVVASNVQPRFRSTFRPAGWRTVVDQDTGRSCVDVEVVVSRDREIPHPPGGGLGSVPAQDDGDAGGRAQAGAVFERGGLGPPPGGGSVDWTNDARVVNPRTPRDGGRYGRFSWLRESRSCPGSRVARGSGGRGARRDRGPVGAVLPERPRRRVCRAGVGVPA
jgi:hypothetical protein